MPLPYVRLKKEFVFHEGREEVMFVESSQLD